MQFAAKLSRSGCPSLIIVVDGLGPGPFAEQASREAMAVFRSQPSTGVASTLSLIDKALTKTRGAAGAIVELSPRGRQVTAAGVGNVSMHLVSNGQSRSFGCDNGTLGAGLKRISEFRHPWSQGSMLVMHSDGIKTRWNLDDYPGMARRHPGVVAGLLYRDLLHDGSGYELMSALRGISSLKGIALSGL